MRNDKVTEIFDRQAASYDQQWGRLAPINGTLHLLAAAVLSDLPPAARILCVGAGTGAELFFLAREFPGWHFTAVEPSTGMLDVLRRRADEQRISPRCVFHPGYLDTLPPDEPFAAATAFLVSQFIQDRHARSRFFGDIADRLGPDGVLVSSDLAGDLATADCQSLLEVWFQVMSGSGPPDGVERMREAYRRDVAVVPPQDVRDIITHGGFDRPVQFFQAGMIHGWYARRSSRPER